MLWCVSQTRSDSESSIGMMDGVKGGKRGVWGSWEVAEMCSDESEEWEKAKGPAVNGVTYSVKKPER